MTRCLVEFTNGQHMIWQVNVVWNDKMGAMPPSRLRVPNPFNGGELTDCTLNQFHNKKVLVYKEVVYAKREE